MKTALGQVLARTDCMQDVQEKLSPALGAALDDARPGGEMKNTQGLGGGYVGAVSKSRGLIRGLTPSCQLNGVDAYAYFDDNETLRPGDTSFSYAIWFHVRNPENLPTVLVKRGPGTTGWGFYLQSPLRVFLRDEESAGNFYTAGPRDSFIGQPVMVTVVVDRENQEMRAYRNGADLFFKEDISDVGPVTPTNTLAVGKDDGGSGFAEGEFGPFFT